MLRVCTSSTEEMLSTSSKLRDLLGATATGDDALQLDLLRRATEWAETHVGYPLRLQTYQETVPAYGRLTLRLSRTPVVQILRLFDATATGSATELKSSEFRLEDADAGLLSRDAGFSWTAEQRWALESYPVPGSESRPWLVEYSAGLALDGNARVATATGTYGSLTGTTSTARSLPYDLEQAVLLKAAEFYRDGGRVVDAKAVGDLRITYRSEGPDGLGPAERLLAPWRRLA